jgi:PAS domain S-box-containing protein
VSTPSAESPARPDLETSLARLRWWMRWLALAWGALLVVDFASESQAHRLSGLDPTGHVYLHAAFWLVGVVALGVIAHHVHRQLALRAEVQDALVAEQERYRLLADYADDFVLLNHIDGRRLYISPSFTRVTGWTVEDLAGDWRLRHHPDDVPALEEAHAANLRGEATRTVYRLRCKDGRWLWMEMRCRPILGADGRVEQMLTWTRDITERQQAEEALRERERHLLETQKLDSLGLLAGGVAHHFNNLLTAILGNTLLAAETLAPGAPERELLAGVEEAALRAAGVAHQMLAYTGRGVLTKEVLDLGALVNGTLQLARAALPATAALSGAAAEGLPAVQGDASQLRQALTNLIVNAAEALGDAEGTIEVTTGVADYDAADLRASVGVEPPPAGRYAWIAVRDDGCGMAAEVLARACEPFFTTRFTGRGLGLSAALGVARAHGGALLFDSTPGVGTTVTVLLPAAAAAAPAPAPAPARPLPVFAGAALLIEEDEAVRTIVGRMLERLGFRPLVVADAESALAVFRAQGEPVSVVLVDLAAHGRRAGGLLAGLRAIDPEVRIVLTTGYDEVELARQCAAHGLAGAAPKPFSREQLAACLGAALA